MKKILFLISTSLFFVSCASKPTEENTQNIVPPQEQIEEIITESEEINQNTQEQITISQGNLQNQTETEEIAEDDSGKIDEIQEQLPEIEEPIVLDLIIDKKTDDELQEIREEIPLAEEEPVFISEEELPTPLNSNQTEIILEEQITTQDEIQQEENSQIVEETQNEEITDIEKAQLSETTITENQQNLQEENNSVIEQDSQNLEQSDVIESTEEEQKIEEEPQIIPSRSVTLNKKEYVDIVYPGSGWIFMGAIDNSKNLTYFGRKLGTQDTKFTLQAKVDGIVILHFYKNDAITGEYIDDYLEVIVLPKNGSSKTHISAPEYAYVVPKQPEDTITKQTEPEVILPTETENTIYVEKTDSEVQTIEVETQEFEEDDGIIVIDEEDVAYVEIDATELFVKAKENFQNQNFQEALTLIIDFLELSNEKKDEALFLQGQIYESSWNGKNIKLAIESYENITKNFPSSSLWDKAKKRITYLKRFYLEAR
ncbi:MAG: hypothetical protein E7060_05215 [Treponema bryantii]|nr:hypothetical protein [Treponema bryantii]